MPESRSASRPLILRPWTRPRSSASDTPRLKAPVSRRRGTDDRRHLPTVSLASAAREMPTAWRHWTYAFQHGYATNPGTLAQTVPQTMLLWHGEEGCGSWAASALACAS